MKRDLVKQEASVATELVYPAVEQLGTMAFLTAEWSGQKGELGSSKRGLVPGAFISDLD